MASLFTKIINGDVPCYKVGENEHCFAFLDIQPLTYGHVLVVPKKEVDYIFDLEDDLLAELMGFSKIIAKKLKSVVECERIGVSVIGLEVPHAHVHLIPINSITDMDFGQSRKSISEKDFKELAKKIENA